MIYETIIPETRTKFVSTFVPSIFYLDMINRITNVRTKKWADITAFLNKIVAHSPKLISYSEFDFYKLHGKGIGLITFEFGIDGVSMEIFKYAKALEDIFREKEIKLPLHFIGGDFHKNAETMLKPYWHCFKIDNMNGWNKWGNGASYARLYLEDMPEGSKKSDDAARGIWNQAVSFAKEMGEYIVQNNISLIVPVNIPSNPGNFAIMLAIVIVTEALGTYVVSSNHDFYWEGGRFNLDCNTKESPDVRDHFFRNYENTPFWELFEKLYPWDGKRWIQVNINTHQVDTLINRFGFNKNKVSEIGTCVGESFFRPASPLRINSVRKRMGLILSDGHEKITTICAKQYLSSLKKWIESPKPIVLSHRGGDKVDLTRDHTLYCLQPTRVVGRKRIEMNLQMLKALFHYSPFLKEFKKHTRYQLVLHITGPVPIEHQKDLETIIAAFIELCKSVGKDISSRIYLAFSVGYDAHPIFGKYDLKPLCIEDIYHLATIILFPSETEGRGLPIIESSAAGIPIICNQYNPKSVFEKVVGVGLPDEEQIKYIVFPEKGYSENFLKKVSKLLLKQDTFKSVIEHNRNAVRLRCDARNIHKKFVDLIHTLRTIDRLYY